MECFCCKAEGYIEYLFGYRVTICDYHYNEWTAHKLDIDIEQELRELRVWYANTIRDQGKIDDCKMYMDDIAKQRSALFAFARSWVKGKEEEMRR